ncbi:MAG TPA: methyltransferase domain-containing protein [Gammaproteobacteria bacterium]|nr:methyltransferase domain-containing protein [Gammaproteobacteria bacterium]
MSIVWQKRRGGVDYQVRRAGRSLRLYTNGVFHSQYNPARPATGSVWDLLLLPAFFHPPGAIRRVLVLGVGGGAVIQNLRRLVQPEAVIGIDRDPVHLSVARRFFGVRGPDVRLVEADAIDWVRGYRGPAFDLVIDDLFGEVEGEPRRAIHAGPEWAAVLLPLLSGEGTLVSNFVSRLELDVSAWVADAAFRNRFVGGFALSTPRNYNQVGAFVRLPTSPRVLRERLATIPGLNPRRARNRLDYRIRTLF